MARPVRGAGGDRRRRVGHDSAYDRARRLNGRRRRPACNLHVFSPNCVEAERHLIFRDWLRSHPEDRSLYAVAKTSAAEHTTVTGGHAIDYNARKEPTVRDIYDRAFRALGLST
jgi:GrpB-like predicted nucleotidyltransferase (UPF0157 family)